MSAEMISINDISNQSTNFLSLGMRSTWPRPSGPSQLEPPVCRSHIERLLQEIDSPELRAVIGPVFHDLLRLLECVGLVENYLSKIEAADETFALFQSVNDEARNLVNLIRSQTLRSMLVSKELADTLDGITFAINHDLQRVFDNGPGSLTPDKSTHVVAGKLYRAHDVITNCLQQSTITLAMVFDSALVGAKLFNNSDMRYRQSLQLCKDLSELIQLVEDVETTTAATGPTALLERIEKFRNESMEYLMYSDWPQFESFCEMIDLSKMHPQEMSTVLHQFRCYLETLLGQVRMRNVLAEEIPLGSFDDTNSHESPTQAENCSYLYSAFRPQDEDAALCEFGIAV